jgi:hypothetical protein
LDCSCRHFKFGLLIVLELAHVCAHRNRTDASSPFAERSGHDERTDLCTCRLGAQLLFGETSSESRFDLVARNLQQAHVAGCQSRVVLRRGSGSFVISGRHESPSALSIDSRQMAFRLYEWLSEN